MAERSYTNGEITVHWNSILCVHCGNCSDGLPAVFNPEQRPWVNMNGGTTDQIRSQVFKCPSGALKITE